MKHMGQDERNRIEFMLGCGSNVASIAKALGRSESTISRELLNRKIDSNKHYGCSNRLCEREHNCPLGQRYYIASGAQANYRERRAEVASGL